MKKIFTLSIITIGLVIFFTGCVKNREYIDESYWLTKERGEVVYSDSFCPYYVVETYNGYAIIRSTSGYAPYEGSIIYGNLSVRGIKDVYNRSEGTIVRGEVTDYWLTYGEAQYLIDNLCY